MQMIGEARRAKQLVKVLNSEGKVVYAKPRYPTVGFLLYFRSIKKYIIWFVFLEDGYTFFILAGER